MRVESFARPVDDDLALRAKESAFTVYTDRANFFARLRRESIDVRQKRRAGKSADAGDKLPSVERLSRGLDRAGNPTAWSVERIFGAKAACALVGPLLGLLYGGFTAKGLFLAGVLAVALFFLPDLLVYNAGLKRQELLRSGLADALDMLTVCVEAGQGFDAALMQVSRATTGPISGEFARVLAEIQIGRPRGEAFSSMAERTSAPEVRNFVSALVQADRLGLPLGAVLREQSQQMRLVRRQRAEEKAQKETVKILFPLLFCIFPLLFIVLMGPGILTMIDAFKGF